MAQKGYFSGKTEYERKQPGGGSGKPGGYNRSTPSGGQGGYRKQGGYGKPGGYKQNNYGDNRAPRDGGYGSDERANEGASGGYNRSNPSGGQGGYRKQGGYGKPGGYKPNNYGDSRAPRDGGYGSDERANEGASGGYNRSTPSGGQGGGYRKQGGYGKPGGYKPSNYGDNRAPRDGGRPYGKPADDRPRYDERRVPDTQSTEPETNQQGETDELPFLIIGRNAVREAVKSGRSIDRILVSAEPDGSLREIVSLARDHKVLVRETSRKALDELCLPFGHGGKTANHQGIVAYAAGVSYCSVEDILNVAKARNEPPFVIVLDGIMDPHNLGSIIRSADCAGAHGVVIGKRRSASVTAATVKAAAGATEHVAIARVTNIVTALETLKKAGVWIAGADMQGAPMSEKNLSGALAFVIGNEGEGIGKLVGQSCDFLVSIPMFGSLDSLNASVAAGVLMFEKRRQDGAAGPRA